MLDHTLRDILKSTRVIAMVGASRSPSRPSFQVGEFLREMGYRVVPVNPGIAGQTLFGESVVATLSDILEPIDMIDVFRISDALPAIFEDLKAMVHVPKVWWTQLGVEDVNVALAAEHIGLSVVENRCPKIEYPRLFGAALKNQIA